MDSLVSENEVKAFEILDRLLDENREKLEKLHSLLGYLSTFPLSQAVAENQQPVSEVYEAYPRLDYLLQNFSNTLLNSNEDL